MNTLEKIRRMRDLRRHREIFDLTPQNNNRHKAKIAGLSNIGNTCYLNSVLQSLRNCKELRDYVGGIGILKDKNYFINRSPHIGAFLTELRVIFYKLETETIPIAPRKLKKLLELIEPTFAGHIQSDAQECLHAILDILHKALKLNVVIEVTGEKTGGLAKPWNALDQYRIHLEHDGYSAICKIFSSQFESRLTCPNGHKSSKFDPCNLIPLEIPPKALTLYDCLDEFMKTEEIEEVQCEQCNPNVGKAIKQFMLWTLPLVLIIQLKRFDSSYRKINTFIQAPQKLNLSKYVSNPKVANYIQNNPAALQLYDLKSVICHSGNLNAGHYTAKCFLEESQQWTMMNDDYISPLNPQGIISPDNYIFFYEMTPATKKWWKK